MIIISDFLGINKRKVEENIETLGSTEDGTIIKNPKLPFELKDFFYIASHLFFDGSYRDKRGCYFYAYDESLLNYHKRRLAKFGEVPMNLIENENQLYFSYALAYIVKSLLEIDNFKSTECYLSDKFKLLCKEHKLLVDEVIKAMIIDEGAVEDKIKVELVNEKFVMDLCEIISKFYNLRKVLVRCRHGSFKEYPEKDYIFSSWCLTFSTDSYKSLYESISPLPIDYKEDYFRFLYLLQNRKHNYLRHREIKKSIIRSLFERPKTIFELSKEHVLGLSCIRGHINGNSKYSLRNLGIIDKIEEKGLRRGCYAKVGIYGIVDEEKAKSFLNQDIPYRRDVITI